MRLTASVLLLLLFLSGWMEGFHFCSRYSKDVKHFYQMNAAEKALEAKLESEWVDGNVVRIVDKTFNGRRGWVYPGDFVYSAEVEGDTAYFILQEAPDEEDGYRVVHMPDSKRELPNRVSLQDFFHWYISTATTTSPGVPVSDDASGAWPPYAFFIPSAFVNSFSPPPEMS